KAGHEGTKEAEEEGIAGVMSFVKEDDVSGSDDEFGKGVAMNTGDQKRGQQQEQGQQARYRRSRPEQRDQCVPAVDAGAEDGEKTQSPTLFARPRRLSMQDGSDAQRALTQELLGMGRAAERCMGEEEAEREVCMITANRRPKFFFQALFMNAIDNGRRDADPCRPTEGIKAHIHQRHRRSSAQREDRSSTVSSSLPPGARRGEPGFCFESRAEAVPGQDRERIGASDSPPTAATTTAANPRRTSSPTPYVGDIVAHPNRIEPAFAEPSRLRRSSFSRSKAVERTRETPPLVTVLGDAREAPDMSGGYRESEAAAADGEDREGNLVGEAEEGDIERRKVSTGGEPRRPKGPGPIVMNASQCEYAIVRECALKLGWQLCETKFSRHSDPLTKKPRTDVSNPHATADASYTCTHKGMCNKLWNVMWHDHGNFEEHLHGLQSFQYYSHLPGLSFFARKAGLAMLMSRMYHEAPKEFKFYPETWVLPAEMNDFRAEFGPRGTSKSIFIVKPDSGCQGKGIFLTKQARKRKCR
ncbi:unnamed protein product, partial [Scytosiphon promiscuus]